MQLHLQKYHTSSWRSRMNKIKLAMMLLPVLRVLYEDGVLDIVPGSDPGEHEYIQLSEEVFRGLFPEVEREVDELTTYLDGVKIMAAL